RVRKELVRTLTRLSSPECEGLVIAFLTDADRGVQEAAVSALSVMRGERAAGIVLDVIRRSAPYASLDSEVRQEAIASAGRMGLKEAAQPLVDILTRKAFIGFAESTSLRLAAVQALGAVGGNLAMEALRAVAQTESKREVRDAAVAALAGRGLETP
ncbi:MAG TPA: HEAT repeat domain-containing protein, partial [Verrucomicrobiae bacterium]|nr:HEAT repeat domain-containing protein [Verrucomicrobiae bacterium]